MDGPTTFTKLRTGAWGVRGYGPAPSPADGVAVTKKNGDVVREVISRILWSDGVSWLASIHARPKKGATPHPNARTNPAPAPPADLPPPDWYPDTPDSDPAPLQLGPGWETEYATDF